MRRPVSRSPELAPVSIRGAAAEGGLPNNSPRRRCPASSRHTAIPSRGCRWAARSRGKDWQLPRSTFPTDWALTPGGWRARQASGSSAELPISPALRSFSTLAGCDAISLAVEGGDDYELLFTVAAADAPRFSDPPPEWGVDVQQIGRVEAGEGIFLEEEGGLRPIGDLGFDHLEDRR
jgi:hypothetical protein